VSRSLGKTVKHLQRVRNSSTGDLKLQVERLLEEAQQLEQGTLQKISSYSMSEDLRKVEKIFIGLQILTACFVAFAHGANDVANAIGPLSAAFQAVSAKAILAQAAIPMWALFLGGSGIVAGLAMWGWKVIRTVGEKITELTPSRGYCAEFAASLTILIASLAGLPVSTTHTLVGAVLGVGLAKGINALNLKVMRDIVGGWIVTIPAGAILSLIFFFLLKLIFIDSGWFALPVN
jgi:phosphate/sulfate permease